MTKRERMSQLAMTDTSGDLTAYRARENVLTQVQQALVASDRWDDFTANLEARGLPEARIRQIVDCPVAMDLHLHSTHSDGQVPAHKLAWLARVIGLRTIALTDHDSVAGCRALYSEAMLLGLAVMPGVELSTGQSGLEILVYFPDAGRFFDFLTSPRGVKFAKYLESKQQHVHEMTLAVLSSVNRWLKRQGVPAEKNITVQELDDWFGGQKPYYPGTLAVLGLKRLGDDQRAQLALRDPRAFNTKVVTPAMKRAGEDSGDSAASTLAQATEDVRKQLTALRRSGAGAVAILSHPKELVTKGKMSIGQVAQTIEYLAAKAGLDGVEVGCSRDTAADVRVWQEILADLNARIAAKSLAAPGPLMAACYASDFHVLAPGRATGEITLGFGMLDERPDHRRGNLRPLIAPEELLEAMRHRAIVREQG